MKISREEIKIYTWALILGGGATLGLVFFRPFWAIGLAMSFSASLFGFWKTSYTITQMLFEPPKRMRKRIAWNHLVNYLLYSAIVVISLLRPKINLFATIAGFFIVKIAVLIVAFHKDK